MFTLLTPTRLCLGLIALYVAVLGLGYGRDRGWLIEADGHRRAIEYVGVRAAGELALAGKPAAAYDWDAHKAAHDQIIGKPTESYYTWPYPPTYLLVASALAVLPYVLSALLLILTTGVLYARTAIQVAGQPRGALWALAAPTTMTNASIAHTGFLVAALFAAGLANLHARPVFAGVMFGLLTFKPQLGLLLPLALVAGGHWRTIAAAALTSVALAAASILVFGIAPWLAMPQQLDRVISDILIPGQVNFNMLVTVYGGLRQIGLGHDVALAAQAVVTLALAIAVVRLWRSDAADALKSAGLLIASLLATPYLFIYDLTVLVMALLFLARHAGTDSVDQVGLDQTETITVLAGGLALMMFAMIPLPVGFLVTVAAGGLVWRRVRASPATASPQTALA